MRRQWVLSLLVVAALLAVVTPAQAAQSAPPPQSRVGIFALSQARLAMPAHTQYRRAARAALLKEFPWSLWNRFRPRASRWPSRYVRSPRDIRISEARSPSLVDDWRAAAGSRSSASKALRRSLERAGEVPRRGDFAHHIVPAFGRLTRRAQEVLQRCGVRPNDAVNGVFLSARLHRRTLTKAYAESINRLIADFDTIACTGHGVFHDGLTLQGRLTAIGEELRQGRFPG